MDAAVVQHVTVSIRVLLLVLPRQVENAIKIAPPYEPLEFGRGLLIGQCGDADFGEWMWLCCCCGCGIAIIVLADAWVVGGSHGGISRGGTLSMHVGDGCIDPFPMGGPETKHSMNGQSNQKETHQYNRHIGRIVCTTATRPWSSGG